MTPLTWTRHPILTREHPPRRIVVLRALQLGDLLVAVPALRALRSGFPAAEITLIGLPWAAAFVQRFSHYVDRFLEFPGFPGIVEVPARSERTRRFLAEQRAYGYDLAIQMHGNGHISNRFVLELGAQMTAGYFDKRAPDGMAVAAPYPGDLPEVQRNLGLVRLLGCPNRSLKKEFPLYADDRLEARKALEPVAGVRPLVVLHAGASSPSRRWPAAYFAVVADELVRRYGARIVLTGGAGELGTVRCVAESMAEPALNLAGGTSLGGLAAIIERADLFIGNDTGPAHLAEAVRTPSVTIFGPADPRRWAPLDRSLHLVARWPVACSPCQYRECPIDHRCLRLLSPELVLELAHHLVAKGAVACNA